MNTYQISALCDNGKATRISLEVELPKDIQLSGIGLRLIMMCDF